MGQKYKVVDNSGAKWAKSFGVLSKKKIVVVGSIVFVSLNTFSSRKVVRKGIVYLGLIVGLVKWSFRVEGVYFKTFSNRILIFNKQYKFLGFESVGICILERIGFQKFSNTYKGV